MNFYNKKLYKSFPSQPFEETVRFALNGSSYHFEQINIYMNRPGMQEAWDLVKETDLQRIKLLQEDINRFHWHLRGFFWELIATFDTLLQWVNTKYALGIDEKDVKWEKIKEDSYNTADWERMYKLLKDAWDSEWFFEVRAYRNFAHRNYNLSQSAHKEAKLIHLSLIPVREDQDNYIPINVQLSNYGQKMSELVDSILLIKR